MLPSAKELTYFYEVAQTLNFSKAAFSLHMSQPALSLAIKRLEQKLKMTLFHRSGNDGLSLTQAGNILLSHTQELLAKWNTVQENMFLLNTELKGVVTIGCQYLQGQPITKLITLLVNKYPDIKINFEFKSSMEVLEDLFNNRANIGIVIDPPDDHRLVSQKIRSNDLAYWKHADLFIQDIEKDLSNQTLFCDVSMPYIKSLLERMRHKKISIGNISNINSFETVLSLVDSGKGIGILPSCLLDNTFNHSLQRIYELPFYPCALALCYCKEAEQNKVTQTIINEISQFTADYLKQSKSILKAI